MRRNKIKTGWSAIPSSKKKYSKQRISWLTKYISKNNSEDTIFAKIVKFLIQISLFFIVRKKSKSDDYKRNAIIDNTYDLLSSTKFRFIPASVAFYFVLSVVPILIISLSIINLFPWSNLLTKEVLPTFIPGIENMFITIEINSETNILITSFFVISLLFFGSKGIVKFSDSFSELYNSKTSGNWVIKRIKSVMLILIISLYFTLVSLGFLPILNFLKTNISNQIWFEISFYAVSFIFLLIFGYLGIGLLFIMISPFKLKWKHINPGILTSLIPVIIFIFIFSTIGRFLKYEKYGAIGSFIYLILFVLYISYFLHAGIIINSAYYKTYYYQTLIYKKSILVERIVLFLKNLYYKIRERKR